MIGELNITKDQLEELTKNTDRHFLPKPEEEEEKEENKK